MFERYTERARRAIFFARYEAAQNGSPYIETSHLLLGMLRQSAGLNRKMGITSAEALANECRKDLGQHGHKVSISVDLPLSNESKRVLAYAAEEAERLRSKVIGLQHLTLGLLRESDGTSELLVRYGVTIEKLRAVPGFEGPAQLTATADAYSFAIEFVCDGKPVAKAPSALAMLCPCIGETIAFNHDGKRRWFKVIDVTHSYTSIGSVEEDQVRLERIVVTLEPKSEPTAE